MGGGARRGSSTLINVHLGCTFKMWVETVDKAAKIYLKKKREDGAEDHVVHFG